MVDFYKRLGGNLQPAEPEFELTSCQTAAAEDILKWAHNDTQMFKTLAGPAGTGKSWLSRYILNRVPQRSTCVCAPTHKALKVVKKESRKEGKTLQSLLGLAVDQDMDDFDPANLKFDKKNKPKVGDYDLILIDEASMISAGLREYVQKQARQHWTKILFVGDPIQLPPVNELHSTVFMAKYIDGGISLLSTPCRQSAGNPAYTLLLADRNDIEKSDAAHFVLINHLETYIPDGPGLSKLIVDILEDPYNSYTKIRKFLGDEQINEEGEGFRVYRNAGLFKRKMHHVFADYFNAGNFNGVRALAWSNACVGTHNKYIRSTIFPDAVDAIVPGDLLMAYRPITKWDSAARQAITLVHNSDEIQIDTSFPELSSIGLPIYSCTARSLDDENGDVFGLDFINPVDYDYNTYVEQYKHYKKLARQRGWKIFYGFYDTHFLLESLKIKFKPQPGYKYLPNKAFDYAYALTIHKSQGSTYNEVFVDTPNIALHYAVNKAALIKEGKWNDQTDQDYQRITRQLRYVAASRAKQFTHFLI